MHIINGKKAMMTVLLFVAMVVFTGCTVQTGSAPETVQTTATGAAETAALQAADQTAIHTATPITEPTATPQLVTLKVFNAEELAQYNGQNGNPAYVAVDGKVYDVTDVPQWKNGSHFGKYQAGADLTEEIKTVSPHGISKLDSVPIVGMYEP